MLDKFKSIRLNHLFRSAKKVRGKFLLDFKHGFHQLL